MNKIQFFTLIFGFLFVGIIAGIGEDRLILGSFYGCVFSLVSLFFFKDEVLK